MKPKSIEIHGVTVYLLDGVEDGARARDIASCYIQARMATPIILHCPDHDLSSPEHLIHTVGPRTLENFGGDLDSFRIPLVDGEGTVFLAPELSRDMVTPSDMESILFHWMEPVWVALDEDGELWIDD